MRGGAPAVHGLLVAKSKRDETSSISREGITVCCLPTRRFSISLKALPGPPVPIETARVAQAVFLHGNVFMQVRDTLGTISTDETEARSVSHAWPARICHIATSAGDGVPIYGKRNGSASGRRSA